MDPLQPLSNLPEENLEPEEILEEKYTPPSAMDDLYNSEPHDTHLQPMRLGHKRGTPMKIVAPCWEEPRGEVPLRLQSSGLGGRAMTLSSELGYLYRREAVRYRRDGVFYNCDQKHCGVRLVLL